MSIVYQVDYQHTDYPTAQEAREIVEAKGGGRVVQFQVSPNLPGRLPERVYRSCAMWVYEDKVWYGINIFGGYGDRVANCLPR